MVTLTNDECARRMGFAIDETVLCTVAGGYGHGICSGDSGGPLVVDGVLVGVGAWLVEDCGAGYPDAFTRVALFAAWIDGHVN